MITKRVTIQNGYVYTSGTDSIKDFGEFECFGESFRIEHINGHMVLNLPFLTTIQTKWVGHSIEEMKSALERMYPLAKVEIVT